MAERAMFPRARAYLITFATYGARLHGAEAGSVDQEHKLYGTELCPPNSFRERAKRERMAQHPYILDDQRRSMVLGACREACEFRGWRLLGLHVRSNHVHVVVQASEEPERVMTDLKGYSSRALNDAGIEANGRKRWARHGSTRYLWNEEQLQAALHYVIHEQGEPMAVFSASGAEPALRVGGGG